MNKFLSLSDNKDLFVMINRGNKLTSIAIGLIAFFLLFEKGYAQCIKIDPNLPVPSPCDAKPGYNLVFSDECNTFNPVFWDKSTPGNDLPGYGDPKICSAPDKAPANASNVFASGTGDYILRVRQGEDQNACDYSGGEIKTFTVSPMGTLRAWKVPKNCYVEARYKMPTCAGVGSGFWLYGVGVNKFYEIDIHEQDPHDPDEIRSNIHFGKSYQDGSHQQFPVVTHVCNLNGNSISLEGKYITFGVEITDSGISMYLNGVFFRHHPFTNNSPYNSALPFNIRLGLGSTTSAGDASDCLSLPKTLNLDYVRVYAKTNTNAIKFLTKTPGYVTLCANNNCLEPYCYYMPVSYYPGATYQWEPSPYYTIIDESGSTDNDRQLFRIWINSGTPPGIYGAVLTVTFPCGYVEYLPLRITVINAPPPAPTHINLYTTDNASYRPGVYIEPNTFAYEWSIDGDPFVRQANVQNSLVNIFNAKLFPSHQPQQVSICVRAVNACGVSPTFCQTVTIPPIPHGCQWCLTGLMPPDEIFWENDPTNTTNFRLKVKKSPVSDAYEWSYNQEDWYSVNNVENQMFNYFGPILPMADSFMMYVRAKKLDTLSTVYGQNIYFGLQENRGGENNSFSSNEIAPSGSYNIATFESGAPKNEPAEDEPVKYCIYNSLGQLVQEGMCDKNIQPPLKEEFRKGLYVLVKYNSENKIFSVSKIVSSPR